MQKPSVRWWHKMIGRDDKFFELLQAAAEEVRISVGMLSTYVQTLGEGSTPPPLSDFAESRRRQKRIRAETIDELHKTLVPPFEREDIQALAFAIYRIPKIAEKIVERISIYPGRVPHAALQRQVELLKIAADTVVQMMGQLLSRTDVQKVTEANARLQSAEGDADKTMLMILKELYAGPYEAKELIILQAIFEIVERAVDRCRDVGNIIVQIVLKNA